MRRLTSSVRANDNQRCTEIARQVDELLPSRAATNERLDVDAPVVSTGTGDHPFDAFNERRDAFIQKMCVRRVFVGMNASNARPNRCSNGHGLIESTRRGLAEIRADDDPLRPLHT